MVSEAKSIRLLIATVKREWAIAQERATVVAAMCPVLRNGAQPQDLGWTALQLHYWYIACERIFERLAVAFDTRIAWSEGYHAELLQQMALDIPGIRPPVLQDSTAKALDEYRAFHHLVRTLYDGSFDQERVRALAERLPRVSQMVSQDWQTFEQAMWALHGLVR
jgi:hypothetical protein